MIWAPLWIVFIGSLSLGGAIDDALARKPAWHVIYGLLAGVLCTLFVAVRFKLLEYSGSGFMLIALAVACGAWLVYEVMLDMRVALERPAPHSRATMVAAIALAVLYLPAVIIGVVHGWNLLG